MSRISVLASVILLIPAALHAQVYQCDGIWTNRPCGEPAIHTSTPAGGAASTDGSRKDASLKRTLVHNLSTANFNAKRLHKVSIETAGIENFCSNEATSLDDCEKRVIEAEDRLASRVKDSQSIQAQERANEIEAQKVRLQELERSRDVVIIQNNLAVHATPTPRPLIIDHSEVGIAIDSGTGISIGGSTGTTTIRERPELPPQLQRRPRNPAARAPR